MILRRLILILVLLAVPSGAAAQTQTGRCSGTPDERVGEHGLRRTLEPLCDYDAAEFNRRLLSVLELRGRGLSIEAVERIFGLPRLVATYDNSRHLHFGALLRGAPGRGDWAVQLSFGESFGPDIPERPERFRGTLRPVRIDPRARGEIFLQISWLLGGPIAAGSPACLPPAVLTAEARRRGWRVPRHLTVISVSHGLPRYPLTLLRHRAELLSDVTDSPDCIPGIEITQRASPPVAPMTAAESAAMQRRQTEARSPPPPRN